jgi:putative PIN family toxin of toxin-antitoxin system
MKKSKKLRIVVDVNCWISSLLKPAFKIRLRTVFDATYCLLVSEPLFQELDRVVQKPYLAERINRTDYKRLVSLLQDNAELVDVYSVVEVCRDPKDNFLLALAKDGNADYLITGDDDLLVLETFEKTKIVKLTDFETVVS